MSEEIIIPFDENSFRLPSCLALHSQLHPSLCQFTSEGYAELLQKLCQTNQSRLCGMIRQTPSECIVLALAFYRIHPTTFDTLRFEIYDLIVDEKERNAGLGTRLLQYLMEQAKQYGAPTIVLQCDLTNTNAHRFFFRHGLTISSFGFCLNKFQLLENKDQVRVIDITDLPDNEKLLLQVQDIFRQLRPHLPSDAKEFVNQIRNICQIGPTRMLLAINNDEKKAIVGLAIYRISNNIKYSKYIYCDDLVTDENHRSLGVGRALINYIKTEGEKLGLHRIVLESGCQRGRAHKFYYREGFHIDQLKFTMLF